MIIRGKGIYEETASRHNLNLEFVESVGLYVFGELLQKLNNPTDLSYELPKFGTFELRFKKFEAYYLNFLKKVEENDPDAIKKRDDDLELFTRCTSIYNKIKAFREDRTKAKEKRKNEIENKP